MSKKRILGIDPGTQVAGYGIIDNQKGKPHLVNYGVIKLAKYSSHEEKLKKLYERVSFLVNEYNPDQFAIEAPFYGKNIQVMLKLGRAQGVAMAAALAKGIPIVEYAPRKIKQSVTGNGNASKEQLAQMLTTILKVDFDEALLLDATDAIGVALCHFYNKGLTVRHSKSWDSFIKDNPDRIKK